jgi:hypothetical protein
VRGRSCAALDSKAIQGCPKIVPACLGRLPAPCWERRVICVDAVDALPIDVDAVDALPIGSMYSRHPRGTNSSALDVPHK